MPAAFNNICENLNKMFQMKPRTYPFNLKQESRNNILLNTKNELNHVPTTE